MRKMADGVRGYVRRAELELDGEPRRCSEHETALSTYFDWRQFSGRGVRAVSADPGSVGVAMER